jgi:Aspartyl/Asparaginyl beta-hydroxylase
MSFATLLGDGDLQQYMPPTLWKVADGRDYQTAFIQAPAGYRAAFYLKLPPKSMLHAHVDAADCETEHVVIQTNEHCLNYWRDADGDHSQHMEAGKRYKVDRAVLHWAINAGDTDRVHLILEK